VYLGIVFHHTLTTHSHRLWPIPPSATIYFFLLFATLPHPARSSSYQSQMVYMLMTYFHTKICVHSSKRSLVSHKKLKYMFTWPSWCLQSAKLSFKMHIFQRSITIHNLNTLKSGLLTPISIKLQVHYALITDCNVSTSNSKISMSTGSLLLSCSNVISLWHPVQPDQSMTSCLVL